jgi:uncharacterized membrane protein YgcG
MRTLVTLLAAFLLCAPAAAQLQVEPKDQRAYPQEQSEERILSFTSDVTIARNGDLDVTETIRFLARGQSIEHGIQRDFPTRNSGPLGQPVWLGFQLVSVEQDGHSEPYELSDLSNGVRIRIGSADRLLPPGEHNVVIRYRTTGQMIYGSDSDKLYWNVTGNGWTFPIDTAEARIRLPTSTAFGARGTFTGEQGATGQDTTVIEEKPGLIVFRTTKPLPAYHGLTISASFLKGVLDAPGPARRLGWWLQEWGALGAAFLSLLLIGIYYVWAWVKVGRDPPAGTIVPQFAPPDGLSAAACRYVARMKGDDRSFTAALVELAVRGTIHIRKEEGGWLRSDQTSLEWTGKNVPLSGAEGAMVRSLFADGDTIVLKQKNHLRLQIARVALDEALEEQCLGSILLRHKSHALRGLACIPAAMLTVALVALLLRPDLSLFALTGPSIALIALMTIIRSKTPPKSTVEAPRFGAWIGYFAVIAIAGICFALFVFDILVEDGEWPVAIPLIALPLAIWAFSWIDAPTLDGRRLMDRIAGFRKYLNTTEEKRLDALHPPEKTPELFERYLPYAIALDAENRWAKRFETVLAAAAASGSTDHETSWYSGSGDFWTNPGSFASSVGSSLTETISSASSSPSSSSGGSSGGGGGGGGGSGW